MRKFTASVLATAVLAGGAFTGAALAAAPSQHAADRGSSAERSSSARHERASRHDSTARDRSTRAAEHDMRDR